MITQYLEIHHDKDNSRNLVPIESIGGVAEVHIEENVLEAGQHVKRDILKTRILINNVPFLVKETYDDIKKQINMARWKLDEVKEQRIELIVNWPEPKPTWYQCLLKGKQKETNQHGSYD
jgi:Zn-finger domain-containing protein